MNDRVRVEPGDCLDVMARMIAAGERVHAVVTDPPYHLTSIVKRFGSPDAAPNKVGKTGAYARASAGFMGQRWDGGDIAFRPETWRLCWELLPPGGWLLAFSATRTYHRMACAIEDAGFEIRDMIAWLYGSGFPKSHNVGLAVDKRLGWFDEDERARGLTSHAAAALDAQGTALKPALEPIVVARKPLVGTVAANVLEFGTGALNIDACRIPLGDDAPGAGAGDWSAPGRWPANVAHDGSAEVVGAFPEQTGGGTPARRYADKFRNAYGEFKGHEVERGIAGSSGNASRFFYSAKADAEDRLGSKHPTVKPVDLKAWLLRLVVPAGGTVLDPFAGSGSTGMAALREGFGAVLIEREEQYLADIRRRLAHVQGLDAPLFAGAAE